MSDSAVQVYSGGTNLAKELVGKNVPEGVLLSPAWKRAAAYILDFLVIMFIPSLFTGGEIIFWLWNFEMLITLPQYVVGHWLLVFGLHYLYFSYTGKWMGRSLGQRWFRIALVHDDATPLGQLHWGRRAWKKTKYAVPVIGLLFFGVRDFIRIRNDERHQSSIDATENTVAAVDWSLPPATRSMLR